MEKTYKCSCGKNYTRKEVERMFGKMFPIGFCSPRCYTRARIKEDQEILRQ